MLVTILLVFAFVFFFLGAVFGAPSPVPWFGRFNVVSAGLACWVLSGIFTRSGLAR